MIPAQLIAEMRDGANKRHRAEVAKMTHAEVIAAHDAECAIAEAAILGGYDLPAYAWTLDRVGVLQEVRASLGPVLPPIEYRVPYVSIERIDGVRLRYPVRCF